MALLAVTIVLGASACASEAESDEKHLLATIADPAGAPFVVTECEARILSAGDAGTPGQIDIIFSYRNTSEKPLNAVSIRVLNFDRTGKRSPDASFAPGESMNLTRHVEPAALDRAEHTFGGASAELTQVKCLPAIATFEDGGTWENPELNAPR